MEFEAIIGNRKGKIGHFNASSICSHLGIIAKPWGGSGYDTNVSKINDFINEERHAKQGTGKNVYVHVSNLGNPQGFCHYLSARGFTLLDSKLTPEKDYQTKQ